MRKRITLSFFLIEGINDTKPTKQTRLMVSARCFIEDVALGNKDYFTSWYLVFRVGKSPSIYFVQIEGLGQLMSCYTLMDSEPSILLRNNYFYAQIKILLFGQIYGYLQRKICQRKIIISSNREFFYCFYWSSSVFW